MSPRNVRISRRGPPPHSEVATTRRPVSASIPNSEAGQEIERSCRAPSVVGRVTPCAPRLQPAGPNFPRRRASNLCFLVPTSEFGFNSWGAPSPPRIAASPTAINQGKSSLIKVNQGKSRHKKSGQTPRLPWLLKVSDPNHEPERSLRQNAATTNPPIQRQSRTQ